jgi:hypothetical protein
VTNALFDTSTALTDKALALEGVGSNPMSKSSRVLFHDNFEDGRYHGWRPVHFGSERPFNPLSVETDYPGAGLYMATAPTPYRSGAFGNTVSTYRGLSGRLPTSGIVTFAGKFYIQSGGPDAYAWSAWGVEMDIQNWSDTKRSNPQWQCANPGDGTAARWQIKKNDLSFTSIGSATGLTNPVNPALSGVSATKGLTGGENENKWDENYIRVSFDLGNLFQITSGTPTAQYYEININGYRFDLRNEGAGSANRSTQGGSALSSFKGGLNFGINLYRDTTSGSKVFPARLVAGELVGLYHETGWLS